MSYQEPGSPAWAPLIEAALVAQAHAWAPYSSYRVGAALACGDGSLVSGCNVENASYGATICAERNAVWHAVATGRRVFRACVVVTRGPTPGPPCGLCRQVLREFASDLPVLLVAHHEGAELARRLTTLTALLPDAFDPALLR